MASDNRWYPPDTITQETDETPPPTRPTRARVVRKKGAKPAAAPGKPRASKQPPAQLSMPSLLQYRLIPAGILTIRRHHVEA